LRLISNLREIKELLAANGIGYALRYIKRKFIAKINAFPTTLTFEVSSACNINCEFCWVRYLDASMKRGVMDFSVFKRTIDETADFCTMVQLAWRGEPMMNRDLYRMIDYANKKNIFSTFSTNATLLNPDNIDKLLNSGLSEIVLAMDGTTKATYESIRRGANFDAVLRNIKQLVKSKKERGLKKPQIRIQFIATKKNYGEIPEFVKFMDKIKPDSAYLKSLYIDTSAKDPSYIRKMVEDYFIDLDGLPSRYSTNKGQDIILKDTKKHKRARCPQDAKYPVISHKGDVIGCCFDVYEKHKFGNVMEKSFRTIWKDRRYADFRKKIMNKKLLPVCKTCLPPDNDVNIRNL